MIVKKEAAPATAGSFDPEAKPEKPPKRLDPVLVRATTRYHVDCPECDGRGAAAATADHARNLMMQHRADAHGLVLPAAFTPYRPEQAPPVVRPKALVTAKAAAADQPPIPDLGVAGQDGQTALA